MLEFRKEIFADERDDNLHEIGQPTQRQDILGHVTGRSRFFDDHCAARTITRASAGSTPRRPSGRPV
jgi:hypothetical protein